jgi:hypothetical protein
VGPIVQIGMMLLMIMVADGVGDFFCRCKREREGS